MGPAKKQGMASPFGDAWTGSKVIPVRGSNGRTARRTHHARITKVNPVGWETISPSAITFGRGLSKVPREITLAVIKRVKPLSNGFDSPVLFRTASSPGRSARQ